MTFLKRFFYLLYYIKKADFKQLKTFLRYSTSLAGKSRVRIMVDILISIFKYNISLKDYFCFRFFELESDERSRWAGTGFMYEYQLGMNPKGLRKILEDKILFLGKFKPFIRREFYSLEDLKKDTRLSEKILANSSGRMVIKGSLGQVGKEVEVISCNDYSPSTLIKYMSKKGYNLVEEYVVQHSSLMALSPSGLNTVRVFTQLHEGSVHLLGARLRVSVNSVVDNLGAGNLAASIDIETGTVNSPGVYSDITKEDSIIHPVTGKAITGFIIPHWSEVIDLAKRAALHIPENRSVGWDIAITEEGPELIEGNHNWCKLLWQLPVKKGLKSELEKYI